MGFAVVAHEAKMIPLIESDRQWSRCAVVVAGIIFDNVEEDDEEDW